MLRGPPHFHSLAKLPQYLVKKNTLASTDCFSPFTWPQGRTPLSSWSGGLGLVNRLARGSGRPSTPRCGGSGARGSGGPPASFSSSSSTIHEFWSPVLSRPVVELLERFLHGRLRVRVQQEGHEVAQVSPRPQHVRFVGRPPLFTRDLFSGSPS